MLRTSIVDEVIGASGLAPVIAGGVIKRCCTRAGLSATDLTRRDLSKLLPLMEPLLRAYLGATKAAERMAALKQVGRPHSEGQ